MARLNEDERLKAVKAAIKARAVQLPEPEPEPETVEPEPEPAEPEPAEPEPAEPEPKKRKRRISDIDLSVDVARRPRFKARMTPEAQSALDTLFRRGTE